MQQTPQTQRTEGKKRRDAHQTNLSRIFKAFQMASGEPGLAADIIDAIDEVMEQRGEAW